MTIKTIDIMTGAAAISQADAPSFLEPVSIADVKAEAERRILAIMPRDQQNNTFAKGIEMLMTHGLDITAWPAPEQARAAAALADWAQIEAIRAASDVIEVMDPIPQDYFDNGYWP